MVLIKTEWGKKVTAIALIALCCFSSCVNQDEDNAGEAVADTTIEQLLRQYDTDKTKENAFTSFNPVYNIKKTQGFKIQYKSLPDDLSSAVTVYRDEVKEGNEVNINISVNQEKEKQYLVIMPNEDGENNKKKTTKIWGNSSSYYLAINYDLNNSGLKKLEIPSIVHFTITSSIPTPQLKYHIDENGNFSLVWENEQKSCQYKVYKKDKDSNIQCIATTITPEFSFMEENQNNGLVYTSQYVTTQNSSITGEYFVTTEFDNKESNFSNGIRISEIGDYIPKTLGEDLFSKKYNSLSELPTTVKVKTLNDKTIDKKIIYDFENVNQNNLNSEFDINYSIQDTQLTGYVRVKSASVQELTGCITMANYNKKIEQPFIIAGNIPIQNDTIINYSVNSVKTDEKKKVIDLDDYIVQPIKSDKKSLKISVHGIPDNCKINANNVLEDYIARQLFYHESVIDMSLFPEVSNYLYLDNTMNSVVLNNPIILGVKSYSYDYKTRKLSIVYYNSQNKSWNEKQTELLAWLDNYLKQSFTTAVDDVEREKILYDFLVESSTYDYDALENAKQNDYQSIDNLYLDSFNAYGALVNKLSTATGYAAAFKLLCDYRGIECKVVSGTYRDIPHVWNIVKINDKWAYVDVANNYMSSGIPYPVFNIGELPQEYKITSAEDDEKITDQDGYYEEQGLAFTSEDELKKILKEQLNEKSVHFVLKNNAKTIDNKKACEIIAKYIHGAVTEVEFAKYFIGTEKDFIVISKTDTVAANVT